MAIRAGITEKRLANKRFKKTEEAIIRSFCSGCESCGAVARSVGVARSTIYMHHSGMCEIVPDYEKFILKRYRRMANRMMEIPGVRIKTIFFKTFCFIITNKKIFKMLVNYDEEKIFREMVWVMKKKLAEKMRLPSDSRKLFEVYSSEIARLMYEWSERNFCDDEIDKLLFEVIYLTNTAKERLKILLN